MFRSRHCPSRGGTSTSRPAVAAVVVKIRVRAPSSGEAPESLSDKQAEKPTAGSHTYRGGYCSCYTSDFFSFCKEQHGHKLNRSDAILSTKTVLERSVMELMLNWLEFGDLTSTQSSNARIKNQISHKCLTVLHVEAVTF